ncbi:uncharacterized protein LOC114841103 [Diachasma alloeum]|uniref:uncharacterized protein LOC114841103 n=1 Tax=Diachasma alloeum TaxID=454923 RepID=UPI0010FBB90D|nr:uncharacterized protein LOC114841103 [Diachasma alloeum]
MVLDNLGPTDGFFQKILRQGLQDETIQNVVLVEKKPVVKEGENYFSYLTRLALKYTYNTSKEDDCELAHGMAHLILKEEPANPGFLSLFTRGLISDKTPRAFLKYLENGLASIGDGIRSWRDGEFVAISNKLRMRSPEIVEKVIDAYECDENELQVLNHGDMWISNIMIREDEDGKLQETRFIDYQMSVWSSPAIDLLFFFSIAPEYNIKMTYNDKFLQQYLARLSYTIKKLGCSANAPTLEQLKESMYKRRVHAIMAGVIFHSKSISEDEDFEPLDDLIQGGGSTFDLLNNPKSRETLEKILPILDERGYLD